MKILIPLIAILLLVGCKTKQTLKQLEIQKELVKNSSIIDSNSQESKLVEQNNIKEIQQIDNKKENFTESEIKGKSDTDNPIEFYNVDNGDTLQTIKVIGNADVFIKTKTSKLEHNKKDISSQSFTEKLKEFSQNIVQENNINERVSEMKKKTQDIKLKGFQAGVWIFMTILGITLILIFFTYRYFKK
jgi:hypothetical protein